jgi:hypothetical protein
MRSACSKKPALTGSIDEQPAPSRGGSQATVACESALGYSWPITAADEPSRSDATTRASLARCV